MAPVVLEVRNMLLSVPGEAPGDPRRVLARNLNMDVEAGELVVLTGPSGCGKSTLLRAISCLDRTENLNEGPREDRVTLKLYGCTPQEWGFQLWRSRVRYVHQKPPVFVGTPRDFLDKIQELKVYKTVANDAVPSAIKDRVNSIQSVPAKKVSNEAKADDPQFDSERYWTDPVAIIQSWGLNADVFDRPWSSFSEAEAQRCFLAIALSLRPPLLLVDEPTSSMDKDACLKVERTLQHCGLTILWVSHDPEQIERIEARIFKFPERNRAVVGMGQEEDPSVLAQA